MPLGLLKFLFFNGWKEPLTKQLKFGPCPALMDATFFGVKGAAVTIFSLWA